jgi:hypothetical protein
MRYTLSVFLGLFIFLTGFNCPAQFLSDFRGRPVNEQRYEQVSGSPFYSKAFIKGEVTFVDKQIKNVKGYLNYDQVQDIILYKPDFEDKSTIGIGDKVSKFIMTPENGISVTFVALSSASADFGEGYAEELLSGKVGLLKRTKKKILETQVYNSANLEKTVVQETNYILIKAGKVTVIKQDRNSFLSAMSDKEEELKKYIKTEKINFKQDADVLRLITYYSSL